MSKEKDGSKRHTIDDNGYDVGRDLLVERATAGTHWKGKWWRADVEYRPGLLEPGRKGVS